MIRIYKDKDTKVVTKGAYEQFYKSLGYNIVLESIDTIEEKVEDTQEEKIEEHKETVSRPRRSSSNNKKSNNRAIEN